MPIELLPSLLLMIIGVGFSPGPGNVFSLTYALRYGRRAALRMWLGLLVGFTIGALVMAFATHLLGEAMGQYVRYVKYVGSAYMVYLAWQVYHFSGKARVGRKSNAFLSGMIVQLTNAKLLLLDILERVRQVLFPGFYDKSRIRAEYVRFLVGHDDTRIPMARSRNNNKNSTMQLTPDTIGLGMRANIDTENNGTARELYSAAGRGDISGMSFRFVADKDRWEDVDTDKPLRRILHIARIIEVSACAFPAYEGTDLEAADESERLESERKRLGEERAEAQKKERRERALQTLRR